MSERWWRIEFERRARKDLEQLDPQVQRRVLRVLNNFDFSASGAVRKLVGRPGYRLRIGDWRVLIEIDRGPRIITVNRILPRGRAYDR
jgi:mRNA interferase RelE/StbE